jgi:hypothetical protein
VTWAADFPAAGVDKTTSLGKFAIRLTQEMGQEWLDVDFCPGQHDNPAHDVCVLKEEFPTLFDPSTKIGRSGQHTDGSVTDEEEGAKVCKAENNSGDCTKFFPRTVKDGDFRLVPDGDEFEEGPTGTKEVHTQIVSFNMTHLDKECDNTLSANAVRAGIAAPNRPRSIGEVESKGSPFPAESFFNMFVEVDVDFPPYDNTIDITLFNKLPLVVQNGNLNNFPPFELPYDHTDGIGVYDKAEPSHRIGWLVIASHGVGYDCNSGSVSNFVEHFDGLSESGKLLVTLDSFTATAGNGEVALEWATGTEKDNAGFKVWRGQPLDGICSNDPSNYTNVQAITPLVNSKGTEVSGATYTMTDSNVVSGNTYCYALEDRDFAGKSTYHLDNIVSATP